MPKICYVKKRFGPAALKTVDVANAIIEDYARQGFELTLRQLYYQFVSRDLIPNTMRSYKNLGNVINDGRLAGLIDWLAIVDRTRAIRGNSHWDSPKAIVQACAEQFQIDKWRGQQTRVEVWIEKDALVGVIDNVCRRNDVPFFSCRGYTSQSEMWVASRRLNRYLIDGADAVVVLHLGDHDPSGIDMTRDISDRLALFCDEPNQVAVKRIALTQEQIRALKPPPNPAKTTDSRAAAYIREYGHESWELDALEPKYIVKLVEKEIEDIRDDEGWQVQVDKEGEHRAAITRVAARLK